MVAPEPADRRFRAAEWRQPYFDYLVQPYLLRARTLQNLAEAVRLEGSARFYRYDDNMNDSELEPIIKRSSLEVKARVPRTMKGIKKRRSR